VINLQQELGKIAKKELDWVTIGPHNDNLQHWRANISGESCGTESPLHSAAYPHSFPNSGPASSPYEGGTFIVDFIFPADYPFKCPEIKFLTKIYHPNIKTDTGEICADIINSNWAPTLDVYHCLETLQSMLLNPSADSPVEAQIATQLRDDYDAFAATAKKWTAEHAS
jgi:ubiquitin-conjugating enzyme E2 D/E